jgi:hypothetical protein
VHAKTSTENQQMTDAVDEVDVGDSSWTKHLRRKEQDTLDRIVHGAETGHYYMILGSKVSLRLRSLALLANFRFMQGAGKTTMILDAMQANQADGVAMCDAHPDLEVFRLRLGKALNYKYNEDSQTGLFSRRDPREGEVFSSLSQLLID